MTVGPRWAVRTADEAVACADATGAMVFAWLCRLVGARSAEGLLARVYVEAAGGEDVDEAGLLATAFRLVADAEDPELAVLARAVIELHSVRGRSDVEVAAIVGITIDDLPAAIASAERDARRAQPDTSFTDIGAEREVWLDDEMRERCREAIRRSMASSAPTGSGAEGAAGGSRRRRMMAAAAIGIVALVVAGVVWARRGGDDPSASGRSGPRVLGGHSVYVLDDVPDGLTAVAPSPTLDADQPIGQLQIWSDPGAPQPEGRWFAVLVARCAAIDHAVVADATRTQVHGRPGVLTHTPDGVAVLRVQTGTNELTSTTLEVRAHGLADGQVERIAASVLLGSAVKDPSELPAPACDATLPAVEIRYDDTFEAAQEGLSSVFIAPWFSAFADSPSHDGEPQFRVAYQSDDPADPAVVTVTTVRRSPLRDIAAAYLREDSADPDAPTAADRTMEVGGQRVVVTAEPARDGSTSDDAAVNVVSWSLGGDTVEISSALPLRRLLPLVGSIRTADETDLEQLQRAPGARSTAASPLDGAVLHSIGSSTTTAGETWQALIEPDTGAVHLQLQGTGVDVRLPLTVDADHAVHEFATADATVLVIALPDDHQNATVVVGLGAVSLPPGPTSTVRGSDTYAVVAFSELGDYTVELVEPGREPQILTT